MLLAKNIIRIKIKISNTKHIENIKLSQEDLYFMKSLAQT